jgi:hypothetical protein
MARLPKPSVPSPKGAASSVGRRLRSLRYAIGDVLFVLGRFPRAIGRGFGAFWDGLSVKTRQRFLLAILGGAAVALFIFVAVPALPCQVPGGDRCPPDDDAATLVPGDALVYAHLNVDPDTDQYEDATELAKRLPTLIDQVTGRLVSLSQVPGPSGAALDFAEDIEPWFGGEAAVAFLPRGRNAEQLTLLEAADVAGAEAFAEEISTGAAEQEEYRGVTVNVDQRGQATAIIGDFLAVAGSAAPLRAVIDVETAAEGVRSLATDPVAEGVRDELPDHRIAEIYFSRDGVDDYVASSGSDFSTLEPFVNARATAGAALAAIAGEGDLELAIRSALDPERSEAQPGFFGAFPGFEPELTGELDDDTLGYVGIGDPERALKQLLTQASADAPGLAEGFTDLSDRLNDLGKVDIEKDLLPSLGDEAAFSLQPGVPPRDGKGGSDQESAPAPGLEGGPAPTPSDVPVPFLSVLVDGVDGKAARDAMARLQGPIAEALKESDVQAPVFKSDEIEGVQAQSLRISPTVNLTYAIIESLLVVATDPLGVEEVAAGEGGLDETDRFESTTEELRDSDPSLLAYLNVGELLSLGEREGLSDDPAYATFAEEARRLLGAALAVRSSEDLLETDARITVAEPPEGSDSEPEPESEAPPSIAPASD